MRVKSRNLNRRGFTLVELLVALIVTSIVLSAVATLAYAMGTANQSSDDSAEKQAQVRFAALRLSEMIKHSKLVYTASESGLVLWQADENDDGQLDADEHTWINVVPAGDGYVQLEFCEGGGDPVVLIDGCNNIQFQVDDVAPQSKLVSISLELVENDVIRHYEINSALRCWAGNLLNGSGEIVTSDDD